MPTPQPKSDPDFIPYQPEGGTPDFIPADGGQPSPQVKMSAPPQEGFMHSLGSSLGLTGNHNPVQDLKDHPIRSMLETQPAVQAAEGLYGMAKGTGRELMAAGKDAMSGNGAGVLSHGIKSIPIIGPGMDKAADQYADNDFGGELGTLTGTAAAAAPFMADAASPAISAAGEGMSNAFPSTARAGKLFEHVMSKAKDQPVSISPETMKPLERTQQLTMAGGKPFGTADKLYQRIQTVNPLTYGEARDFAQNMSLSPEEKMGLKKSMRYEVPRMAKSFNDDVGRAATDAGVGPDYQKAMKMYRRGSQIESAGRGLVKYGGRAALGAVGAGSLYELGKSLGK